jgi:hypothetical protein
MLYFLASSVNIVELSLKILLEDMLFIPSIKEAVNGGCVKIKHKFLLWQQKHYIHSQFHHNDAFLQSILYLHFYINFMGHKKQPWKMN